MPKINYNVLPCDTQHEADPPIDLKIWLEKAPSGCVRVKARTKASGEIVLLRFENNGRIRTVGCVPPSLGLEADCNGFIKVGKS